MSESEFDLALKTLYDLLSKTLAERDHTECVSEKYLNRVSAKDHTSIITVEKEYLDLEVKLVQDIFNAKTSRISAEKAVIQCKSNELKALCDSIKKLETIKDDRDVAVDSILNSATKSTAQNESCAENSGTCNPSDVKVQAQVQEKVVSRKMEKPELPDCLKKRVEDNKYYMTRENRIVQQLPKLPPVSNVRPLETRNYGNVVPASPKDESRGSNFGRSLLKTSKMTSANGSFLADDSDDDPTKFPVPRHMDKLHFDLDLDNSSLTEPIPASATKFLKPALPNSLFSERDNAENVASAKKPRPPPILMERAYSSEALRMVKPKPPPCLEELLKKDKKIAFSPSSAFQPLKPKNDGFAKPEVPPAKMKNAFKELRRSIDSRQSSALNDTYALPSTATHAGSTAPQPFKIETFDMAKYNALDASHRDKLSIHELNFAIVTLNQYFEKKGSCAMKRADLQRILQGQAMLDGVQAMLAISVLSEMGKLQRFKSSKPARMEQDVTIFVPDG